MSQRIVLHLDLNYFFAQAEELRKPELKGKPVVVCIYSGRSEDSGAVSTCNYEARDLGIHSGMSIYHAKSKANDETIFIPVDMTYYFQLSKKVMATLSTFSDQFEQMGVDEAYLDITEQTKGAFSKAKQLALRIKQKLVDDVGLISSVGIGENKLIAKIASNFEKPDGLTVVPLKETEKFLSKMSVRAIPGIGPKTGERLNKLKIEKVAQLRKKSLSLLIKEFGKARGHFLYQASHGADERPVEERGERKQFSRMGTLQKDTRDLKELMVFFGRFIQQIHKRCVEKKRFFKTVSIICITSTRQTQTKSRTLPQPTQDLTAFEETIKSLLSEYLNEHSKIKLSRGGVRVAQFSDVETTKQRSLSEF